MLWKYVDMEHEGEATGDKGAGEKACEADGFTWSTCIGRSKTECTKGLNQGLHKCEYMTGQIECPNPTACAKAGDCDDWEYYGDGSCVKRFEETCHNSLRQWARYLGWVGGLPCESV